MRGISCIGLLLLWAPLTGQEENEPYLTIEDQKALLDKKSDQAMEADVTAQRKSEAITPRKYVVRIEIFKRIRNGEAVSYIGAGDLSISPGYFFWAHDGKKPNGYAVFMYPVERDKSKIKPPAGVRRIYGKSFTNSGAALDEVNNPGSAFRKRIGYPPVIKRMNDLLNTAPYSGGGQ